MQAMKCSVDYYYGTVQPLKKWVTAVKPFEYIKWAIFVPKKNTKKEEEETLKQGSFTQELCI